MVSLLASSLSGNSVEHDLTWLFIVLAKSQTTSRQLAAEEAGRVLEGMFVKTCLVWLKPSWIWSYLILNILQREEMFTGTRAVLGQEWSLGGLHWLMTSGTIRYVIAEGSFQPVSANQMIVSLITLPFCRREGVFTQTRSATKEPARGKAAVSDTY